MDPSARESTTTGVLPERSSRRSSLSPSEGRSPVGYGSFSPHAPAVLTVTGGILMVLGSLGAWIRVATTPAEGTLPEQAVAVSGASEPAGWGLAALGAATAVASVGWYVPRLMPKAAGTFGALGLVGLLAWRLPALDARAAAMVERAQLDPSFIAFHAGFGWGAWLLIIGAVGLFVGISAGFLRELDVRRGVDT